MDQNLNAEHRTIAKNDSRERLLSRIEGLTELPLTVLALMLVPLLIGPLLFELDPQTEQIYRNTEYIVWAIFIVDIMTKILISTARFTYIKKH